MQASLNRYRLLEARHAIGWAPLLSMFVGFVLIGLASLIMPRMPASALGLMERAMHLRGMGAMVVVNDYLSIYFIPYFVGVAGLMRALVEPREERLLEVLLSKPISRRAFLSARVGPVLLAAGIVGAVLSLASALAVHPYAGEGSVSVAGALGSGFLIMALTTLLLSLLVLPLLVVRDSFQGLLVAFGVWMAPLMPLSVLLYRPDVFEGKEAVRDLLAFPANLIWFDASMLSLGLIALVVAQVASSAVLALGAFLFERTELR